MMSLLLDVSSEETGVAEEELVSVQNDTELRFLVAKKRDCIFPSKIRLKIAERGDLLLLVSYSLVLRS